MEGCGGCGEPTRREFLKTSVAIGAAALAITLTETAGADRAPDCDKQYARCLDTCTGLSVPRCYACQLKCYLTFWGCLAAQTARSVNEAISEATRWIADHPGIAIGSLFACAGFVFIVAATGGGALVAVFA